MLNNSVRLGHIVSTMYTNFTYDASGRWKFKGFDRLRGNLYQRQAVSPINATGRKLNPYPPVKTAVQILVK